MTADTVPIDAVLADTVLADTVLTDTVLADTVAGSAVTMLSAVAPAGKLVMLPMGTAASVTDCVLLCALPIGAGDKVMLIAFVPAARAVTVAIACDESQPALIATKPIEITRLLNRRGKRLIIRVLSADVDAVLYAKSIALSRSIRAIACAIIRQR